MRIIKTRQAFDGDEKDSGDEKGSERGSETQPSRPPSLRAPSLAKAPPPEAKCLRRDGSPMGRSSARPNRSSSHAKELYNSDDEQHTKLDERVVGFSVDERSLRDLNPLALVRSLLKKGLHVVEMAKDGNCMFRAVADQIYGDAEMHDQVRKLCMDFMEAERDHFSQFVVEDFADYIRRKRQMGTYGNHLELQAIAELYNRPILIYAIDEKPLNIFQGMYETDNPPLRLSYHYGNHYNSVRDPDNPSVGVGLGLPDFKPKSAAEDTEQQLVQHAQANSEQEQLEQELLFLAQRESRWVGADEDDELQETLDQAVIERSYYDF